MILFFIIIISLIIIYDYKIFYIAKKYIINIDTRMFQIWKYNPDIIIILVFLPFIFLILYDVFSE